MSNTDSKNQTDKGGLSARADQYNQDFASKKLIEGGSEVYEEEKNDKEKTGEGDNVKDEKAEEQKKPPVNAGKKLMVYAKREWCMFVWGIITLIGGSIGQLVIPYYVGLFTNKISKGLYKEVYPLCW
jgi:hypothetical protein